MHQSKLGILAPCYNEGQGIIEFLTELKEVLEHLEESTRIVIIDDGSIDETKTLLLNLDWQSKIPLDILILEKNIGHQGAISKGIKYCSSLGLDNLIVMDSDGQDDPNAIPKLLNQKNNPIVFVSRKRRKESISFRAFYSLYQLLFLLITGEKMNFGNYSMIDQRVLSKINNKEFIHYAAFLFKLNYMKKSISCDRLQRTNGSSKMNFYSLVSHGFKSIMEYTNNKPTVFYNFALAFLLSLVLGTFVFAHRILTISIDSRSTLTMLYTSFVCTLLFGLPALDIVHNHKSRNLQNTVLNHSQIKYRIIRK